MGRLRVICGRWISLASCAAVASATWALIGQSTESVVRPLSAYLPLDDALKLREVFLESIANGERAVFDAVRTLPRFMNPLPKDEIIEGEAAWGRKANPTLAKELSDSQYHPTCLSISTACSLSRSAYTFLWVNASYSIKTMPKMFRCAGIQSTYIVELTFNTPYSRLI